MPKQQFNSHNEVMKKIDKIEASLRGHALKLTGNKHDADDLYQDTAVKILTNFEKYKKGSNFTAWCYTVMRNTFINKYRKKMRKGGHLQDYTKSSYLSTEKGRVENTAPQTLGEEEILNTIDALPIKFKTPFMMTYKGYSYKEIAQELDIPLGTTKSRIFYAREKLKKELKPYNTEGLNL